MHKYHLVQEYEFDIIEKGSMCFVFHIGCLGKLISTLRFMIRTHATSDTTLNTVLEVDQ